MKVSLPHDLAQPVVKCGNPAAIYLEEGKSAIN